MGGVSAAMNTIYLESSILVTAGWPRPSTELTNLMHMARMHGVGVIMPLAVEMELEERWIRETEQTGKEIAGRVGNFNRQTRNCLPSINVELPGTAELRRQYRERIQTIKEGFLITVIPLSSRSLEVLYEMATKLIPPFEAKGVGFKDAVILFSVLDHLEANPEHQGALIAGDQMFDKALGFFPPVNGRIQVYKEIKEVYGILLERMTRRYFEAWQEDRREIKSILERRITELQQFIESNLEFYTSQLPGLVQSVKSIEISDIKEDTVQAPIPRPKNGEEVQLSFEVGVKLHAVVTKFPSIGQRPLRVGEVVQVGAEILSGPREEEETLDQTVKVEASASYNNGYKDIRFVSVSLNTAGFGLGLGLGLLGPPT
jgi:hypothetical protein